MSLLVLGVVSIVACLFSLGMVIDALITTRILVQFIGQIVALTLLRRHAPDMPRPYRMWLYPVPTLVALFGWIFIFATTGAGSSRSASGPSRSAPSRFFAWSRWTHVALRPGPRRGHRHPRVRRPRDRLRRMPFAPRSAARCRRRLRLRGPLCVGRDRPAAPCSRGDRCARRSAAVDRRAARRSRLGRGRAGRRVAPARSRRREARDRRHPDPLRLRRPRLVRGCRDAGSRPRRASCASSRAATSRSRLTR